jgi:hypothetical protein
MSCPVAAAQRAGFGIAPLAHASRLLMYEASVVELKRAENAIERSKRDFF